MATLPYIQFYVADYLADTAHLSTLENGAYLLLIFNYWQRGESFKANDERSLNKRLAAIARLSIDEWENVRESLAEFFEVSETEWKHPRIERDLEAVNAKSEKARAAGKASAARKSNGRSTDVEQPFNHKDKDKDKDKDILGDISAVGEKVTPIRKRATQMPENFEPNDRNREVARESGVSLVTELQAFADFHLSKGSTFKDWHLALNTWLRNAKRFDHSKSPPPPKTNLGRYV